MNRILLRIAVLVSLFVLPAVMCARAAEDTWNAPVANPAGPLVMRVVMTEDQQEDPAAAGKAAAEALLQAMEGVTLKAVVVSECFEDKENKEKLLRGIGSVLIRRWSSVEPRTARLPSRVVPISTLSACWELAVTGLASRRPW